MNTPTKEYGFLTAITPEEIKWLGNISKGDQVWGGDKWFDPVAVYSNLNEKWLVDGNPVRRPIEPGEGWEKVGPDEIETEEMEYLCNGVWKSNAGKAKHPCKCGNYLFLDGSGIKCFRRRKQPSDEWEIVPKDEVDRAYYSEGPQPTWQYKNIGTGLWEPSTALNRMITYRRPKSKPQPVEQYDWLSVDSGVPIPNDKQLTVLMSSGVTCEAIYRTDGIWIYFSSRIPTLRRVTHWFRMPPHPAVKNVDPRVEAWKKFCGGLSGSEEEYHTFTMAWKACEAHYKVGDQSKGAK